MVFKYVNGVCPGYLTEVFETVPDSSINLRKTFRKMKILFHKTATGQNSFSLIGPSLWNKVPESLKKVAAQALSSIIRKSTTF